MQTHFFFGVESDKNNLAQKLPALWSAFLPRLGEVPQTVAAMRSSLIAAGSSGSTAETSRIHYAIPVEGVGPA